MSLSIGLCQGKKLEGKAIAKHNSKKIESSYPIFSLMGNVHVLAILLIPKKTTLRAESSEGKEQCVRPYAKSYSSIQ